MTVGVAWSRILPDSHRDALDVAISRVFDEFFNDYHAIESEELSFDDSSLGWALPPKYKARYTPLFAKRFFACLSTVAWKLTQLVPQQPLLSCTAEELALYVLIQQAKSILELQDIEDDFDPFEEVVFQDLDFEILYQMELDGLEDSNAGTIMGVANLRFDDWFKPFKNAASEVHPYAVN